MFMGPNLFILGSQSALPGIKDDYISSVERKERQEQEQSLQDDIGRG